MSNIKILSKDNSPYGKDTYRDTDGTIPAAFRATHVHSTDMNKSGTNSNVNIRTLVPVLDNIEGRVSSTNAFSARTYFTSLQHITSEVERAKAFDEHLKMLVLGRDSILAGILPDEPIDTAPTLKTVLADFSASLPA